MSSGPLLIVLIFQTLIGQAECYYGIVDRLIITGYVIAVLVFLLICWCVYECIKESVKAFFCGENKQSAAETTVVEGNVAEGTTNPNPTTVFTTDGVLYRPDAVDTIQYPPPYQSVVTSRDITDNTGSASSDISVTVASESSQASIK